MYRKTSARILGIILFLVVFVVLWYILKFGFAGLEHNYRLLIAVGAAWLVSPSLSTYQTESGERFLLKWRFLNKEVRL